MKQNWLLFVLWSTTLLAQEPVAQPAPSLANVRWQSLPRGVENVFVGPDGRTWYQWDTRAPSGQRTVASVKRQIEKEFHNASPRIEDLHFVLFEPGGRVWFSFRSNSHMMLLGYDGK